MSVNIYIWPTAIILCLFWRETSTDIFLQVNQSNNTICDNDPSDNNNIKSYIYY